MRRIPFFWLLVILMLFIGIIIGSTNTVGQRGYFEQAKEDFENSISDPNHTNLPIVVEKDTTTKFAQKIDSGIYNAFRKILKKIASD